MDRLGRTAMDVASTVAKLAQMGVRVHCLQLGSTDLTSAAGKMPRNSLRIHPGTATLPARAGS